MAEKDIKVTVSVADLLTAAMIKQYGTDRQKELLKEISAMTQEERKKYQAQLKAIHVYDGWRKEIPKTTGWYAVKWDPKMEVQKVWIEIISAEDYPTNWECVVDWIIWGHEKHSTECLNVEECEADMTRWKPWEKGNGLSCGSDKCKTKVGIIDRVPCRCDE